MRYLSLFFLLITFVTHNVSAHWTKINDIDYVWGPFTIYNFSLFSETGEYREGTRPLMLSLKYRKPVDGRDFAISLARSWSNLGITLPQQDSVVDRLRKIMPNIKKGDLLSYIALQDKGYFILNDTIIDEEFNQDFNNAVVAVWLDPRVEIGKALLSKQKKTLEMPKPSIAVPKRDDNASFDERLSSQAVSSEPKEAVTQKESSEQNEGGEPKESGMPKEIDEKTEKQVNPAKSDKLNEAESSQQNVPMNARAEAVEQSNSPNLENKPSLELPKKEAVSPKHIEENKRDEEESLKVLPPNDPVLLKEQPLG